MLGPEWEEEEALGSSEECSRHMAALHRHRGVVMSLSSAEPVLSSVWHWKAGTGSDPAGGSPERLCLWC